MDAYLLGIGKWNNMVKELFNRFDNWSPSEKVTLN